jgi:hypothetical protein
VPFSNYYMCCITYFQEGVLGEWRCSSTHYLTSALDAGKWSASHPGRFTPRERTPATHWIGGWVGPRAVLDAVVKRKIHNPCRESNPRTPIVQPLAQRCTTELSRLLYTFSRTLNDASPSNKTLGKWMCVP